MKTLLRVMAVVLVITTANFASAITKDLVNAKAHRLTKTKTTARVVAPQAFSYNFQVRSYGASSTMFLLYLNGTMVSPTIETVYPYGTPVSFNSNVTPNSSSTVVLELRGGYTPVSANLGTYMTNVSGVINATAGTITFSNVNITTKSPGLMITLN